MAQLRAADILNAFDDRQLRKLIGARKIQSKIENLEAEIRYFHQQVDVRIQQKKALEKKLDRILKGAKPRQTRRGGPALPDAVVQLLSKMKKPLRLTEITKAILDSGYKTSSVFNNFRTTVAHTLRRLRPQLSRKGDGYMVKNGKKTAKAQKAAETPAPASAKAK